MAYLRSDRSGESLLKDIAAFKVQTRSSLGLIQIMVKSSRWYMGETLHEEWCDS